ncbi:MAG: 50S ribosomal protein L10 [Patescibacteria group bacterium]
MAISRQAKEETLKLLQEKLRQSKGIVFTHYQGLTVKDITALRRSLREQNVELVVAKKTLLHKAFSGSGFDPTIVEKLQGSVALAFGLSDEVMPAKLLQQFAKDHPAVELLGGIVAGQVMDASQAVALAKLPSRDELRAKTVWILGSPLSGTVNVLAGTLRSFLNVLNALHDKQPAPASAA